MEVSATKGRARSNRLRSTLFVAALLAACFGSAGAQSPMLSDAEVRDLRHEARSMHRTILPVPAAEPTAAEMWDLRRLAQREQGARQNVAFGTVR